MECQTLLTTKCVLCLRPTEKMSDENICRQQKIADVYMTYLKPKLTTIAESDNWSSLVKERTANCQFCSDCMKAGQNLTSMNDQLLALQCEIQDFVQNLSEEILKYRDELDTRRHQPVDSVLSVQSVVPPNPQQFLDHSLQEEIGIKNEAVIIKEEVDIESVWMVEEVDEYISKQASVNPQDHLENHVTSPDPFGDHVDSNDATCIKDQTNSDITEKTSTLLNGNELSLENSTNNSRKRKKQKKDVLKNLKSRKVISCQPTAQCSKCDKVCLDREALKDHMISAHPKNKFAFCAVCPDLEKFTDRYKYEIHIMTHTEEIPYDCPKCHEKFSNARNYCEHQTSSDCANSDGIFVCAKCYESFKAKYLLLTHTTVFHKASEKRDYTLLQCDLCETLPMLQCQLEDHYAEHTEECIIPCDICGMSLQNLTKFDEHRKSHRSSVGIPYITFDKTLFEDDDEDIIEYSCEHCNKKFINATRKYLSHIKKCQSISFFSFHICDICGKKFSYPDRLANHIKGHTEGFPTCTKCNKQFETEERLTEHVKKRKGLEEGCELNPVAAKKRKLDKSESNSKHVLKENEHDMDTDVNEATEKQISKILSGEDISLDEEYADENLECTLCSVNFSDFNSFESHVFKDHKEITVQCYHCEEIFLNHQDFRRHVRIAHPMRRLFCPACPDLEKFPNIYECQMHCMTHTEEIPYDCPTCHEKFSNVKNYCEHQKSSACANAGGQFQCVKCEAVFKGRYLLLTHMTVLHKDKGKEKRDYTLFQCELCEKSPMRKFHLEDHYAEHTKEFLIPCDICGMLLQSCSFFNAHRKSHRATVAIPCSSCDEKFKSISQLLLHIKMMHTEGQVVTEITCENCGRIFTGKEKKYRLHVKSCSKFHICDICGRKYRHPERLANHRKGHTEGFPTCTICNKQFDSDAKLKAHSDKMHLEKQTVIDEPCGETPMSKEPPEEHIKKQIFQIKECEICGKMISGKKMRKHKRVVHNIHKSELIPCEYCPDMFLTGIAQRRHEDAKHWEVRNKNFQCTGCERIFMQERQLAKHKNLMHPELQTRITNTQCLICNKILHDANGLICHMRSKHENEID